MISQQNESESDTCEKQEAISNTVLVEAQSYTIIISLVAATPTFKQPIAVLDW